jgi:hypothetical protein
MSDAGAISLTIIFNVIRASGPVVNWLSLQNNGRCHEKFYAQPSHAGELESAVSCTLVTKSLAVPS